MGYAAPQPVSALDADAAGQPQGRLLARQAALRGKRVAVLHLDACPAVGESLEVLAMPADL